MLNLTELMEQLKDETEWQETPMPLTDNQYLTMVVRGLERLFVDTGRAAEYDETKFQTVTEDEQTFVYYDWDFMLDERIYIMLCAKIGFFQKVQSDVNNTFGYTTNALSVTNADKPYANLRNTIESIDNDRRIVYYKMVRYTLGVS